MQRSTIHTELRHAVRTTVMGDPATTLQNIILEKKTKAFFSYALANSLTSRIIGGSLKEADISKAIEQSQKEPDIYNYQACSTLTEIQSILNIRQEYVHPLHEGVVYYYQAQKSLAIKPQCFYVDGDRTIITWVQYCKGFHYNSFQFGLIAQILKESYVEKFDNVEILIIDTSSPKGEKSRVLRHHFGSKLPSISEVQKKDFFATYSEALEMARTMGIDLNRKTNRANDSFTDDLFR